MLTVAESTDFVFQLKIALVERLFRNQTIPNTSRYSDDYWTGVLKLRLKVCVMKIEKNVNEDRFVCGFRSIAECAITATRISSLRRAYQADSRSKSKRLRNWWSRILIRVPNFPTRAKGTEPTRKGKRV